MNPYHTSNQIKHIEKSLKEAIKQLREDKIFISKKENNLYLKSDKNRISKKWYDIKSNFKKLKKLIKKNSFTLFFSYNNDTFVIKHYLVYTYYNFVCEIQSIFGPHEDFVRQFLDEQYKLNYSKIARYMYYPDFMYFINYPQPLLNTLKGKVDEDILWMIETKKDYSFLGKRFVLDKVNIFYYIKYRVGIVLYYLVKYVGLFMSKIKVTSRKKGLILQENRKEYLKIAKNGDILLSRKNRVGTNISIPGFWKHMAMFVGTGNFIKTNFKGEGFELLDDEKNYIIESTSKGVLLSDFDNYCDDLDYLGVLRINFSFDKIKRVIKQTLSLINSDYDYSFNYYSDKSFVCSELITKAYLKDDEFDEGLDITLEKVATGVTYPPNQIVKKAYLEKDDENRQLDPVFFIDSLDKKNKNFVNKKENLLTSWKRSRFSFFLR